MPQTAYVGGLTLKPIKGLNIQGLLKVYDDNYADWSPESREVTGDEKIGENHKFGKRFGECSIYQHIKNFNGYSNSTYTYHTNYQRLVWT